MLLVSDPETYALAFTRERAAMDPLELRRDVYAQMWLHLYSFGYETGQYTEALLQSSDGAESLFDTEHVRRHWAKHRLAWMSDANPKTRRFARILDDGYHRVLAAGPVADPPPYQSMNADVPGDRLVLGRLAMGVAVLVAAGWLAGRRRS